MKITVANSKGGTVKTTTAIMLGCALHAAGHTIVVWDADPQGSATAWAEAAVDARDPLPFDVIPVNARSVRRPGPLDIDVVLIDTNPHTPEIVQGAIDTADLVIVPTTASPLDMDRTWSTLDTVAHRPHRVLLARAEPRTIAHRETLTALDDAGVPRFQTWIPKTAAIKADSIRRPRQLHGYDAVATELEELLP